MEGLLTTELYASLKKHFDDAQIVEMGMIAAFLTGMAKFLFVFDLVTREVQCPIVRPTADAAVASADAPYSVRRATRKVERP